MGEVAGALDLWACRPEIMRGPVERSLMGLLHGTGRVLVDSALDVFFVLLKLLWLGQTSVEHHLIVLDESHLPLELVVVGVLTLREDIHPLGECGSVAVSTLAKAIVALVILPQVVVEGAVRVGWSVGGSEATRVV